MQDIIIYAVVENGLARCVEPNSNQPAAAPTLIRGSKFYLDLRLLAAGSDAQSWPLNNISAVKSWQWVMSDGFNSSGNAVLAGDNENIAAGEITVNGTVYTQITIPVTASDTCEVRAFLGFEESRSNLNGELIGWDKDGETVLVIQILDFTLRNRVGGDGMPEEAPELYLTQAQARAMWNAGIAVEISQDREVWCEYSPDADWTGCSWWRWKYNLDNVPYSPALPLGQGSGGAVTPFTAQCFYHDSYGTVCYWDDDNALEVVGYQAEVWKSLDLYIVSADSSVTGNIVLTLGDNRLVAPVSAALTKVTWDLTIPAAGLITISRNTTDAEDTLKDSDGNVVTALLVDWRVK